MKLIFIDQEPLTPRRKKVFEIEALSADGFLIEFWDMSAYCFKNVVINNIINAEYVTKITTFEDYKRMVCEQNINDTIFVFEGYLALIKPELNSFAKSLKALTVRYEINTTSKLPVKGFCQKMGRLMNYSICEIIKRIREAVSFRINNSLYPSYSFIISTGTIIPADIYINHSDYIQYLEMKNIPPLIHQPYIVFLDQFYPYHPDLQSHGVNIEKNAEKFFHDINCYFAKLEEIYSMEVIIAAHPKANYNPMIFNNRKIIYGKSNLLVKDAEAVIAITSASISFAIMNNKPLALVVTNDILNTPEVRFDIVHYQYYLANLLGLEVVNISNSNTNSMLKIKKVSKPKRDNYLYSYLTSQGIENKYNIELLPLIYKKMLNK